MPSEAAHSANSRSKLAPHSTVTAPTSRTSSMDVRVYKSFCIKRAGLELFRTIETGRHTRTVLSPSRVGVRVSLLRHASHSSHFSRRGRGWSACAELGAASNGCECLHVEPCLNESKRAMTLFAAWKRTCVFTKRWRMPRWDTQTTEGPSGNLIRGLRRVPSRETPV